MLSPLNERPGAAPGVRSFPGHGVGRSATAGDGEGTSVGEVVAVARGDAVVDGRDVGAATVPVGVGSSDGAGSMQPAISAARTAPRRQRVHEARGYRSAGKKDRSAGRVDADGKLRERARGGSVDHGTIMGRIEGGAVAGTQQDCVGRGPFHRAAGVRADRVEGDEGTVRELPAVPYRGRAR